MFNWLTSRLFPVRSRDRHHYPGQEPSWSTSQPKTRKAFYQVMLNQHFGDKVKAEADTCRIFDPYYKADGTKHDDKNKPYG